VKMPVPQTVPFATSGLHLHFCSPVLKFFNRLNVVGQLPSFGGSGSGGCFTLAPAMMSGFALDPAATLGFDPSAGDAACAIGSSPDGASAAAVEAEGVADGVGSVAEPEEPVELVEVATAGPPGGVGGGCAAGEHAPKRAPNTIQPNGVDRSSAISFGYTKNDASSKRSIRLGRMPCGVGRDIGGLECPAARASFEDR